jgi:hypothetical protein
MFSGILLALATGITNVFASTASDTTMWFGQPATSFTVVTRRIF